MQCQEASDVPTMRFNFVPLRDLEQLPKDSTCGAAHVPIYSIALTGTLDVIGIVKDFTDVSEIMTRQSRPVCPTLGWDELYY